MGAPTKIPERLEGPLLEKAGSGLGCRALAAWLKAEHGVSVGHAAVARWLKQRRSERADVAKAVVREKVAATATRDIDRLELFVRKAMRIARGCEDQPEVWVKLADQLRKLTESKLKAAGLDQPDEPGTNGGVRVYLPPEDDGG